MTTVLIFCIVLQNAHSPLESKQQPTVQPPLQDKQQPTVQPPLQDKTAAL